MKKYSFCYKSVFLFFIILAISFINPVYSESSSNDKKIVNLSDSFSVDPSIDKDIQKNLININKYAKKNFEKNSLSYGYVEIDSQNTVSVYELNGKLFAKIPAGYSVEDESFLIKNNNAEYPNEITISGINAFIEKGSKLSFSKKEDQKIISIIGKGNLIINNSVFQGVSNANFKFDSDNHILSAHFISDTGGTYRFETKFGTYKFDCQKGGEITWDLLQNKLSGKKTSLTLPLGDIINSAEFSVSFDPEKGPNKIITVGFSNFIDISGGKNFGNDLNIFYGSKNSDVVKSFEGNAILLSNDNLPAAFKGEVQYANLNGIRYQGLLKDTYTKYNSNNNFDIKSGDAEISNGKNTVNIKNGEVSLRREELLSDNLAESFSFNVYKTGGAVKSFVGNLDTKTGLLTFKDNSDLSKPAYATVFLSSYEGILSDPIKLQENYIKVLNNNLNNLINSGASSQEINAYRLAVVSAENIQLMNQYGLYDSGREKSIENLQNYLSSIKDDPVSEANAKIKIAELYTDQNKLDEAISYYKSAKESAFSKEDSYQDQYNAAAFGLAAIYRQKGDKESAISEYNLLAKSNDLSVSSSAYMGIAQLQISSGDYKSAIESLGSSIAADPDNSLALNIQKSLRDGILTTMYNSLTKEKSSLDTLIEDSLGAKNSKSWSETPWESLKSVFGESGKIVVNALGGADRLVVEYEGKMEEIDYQKAGIYAFMAVNKNSDIASFANTNDYSTRRSIIAEAMGMNEYVLNPNNIYSDFMKETGKSSFSSEEERYNFIESHYGSKYAVTEKFLSYYTQSSFLVQKNNPDIQMLVDPTYGSGDFKFKTGEGYVDLGLLKKTWGDNILDQVTLNNALLMMAPFGTVSAFGKTYTFAGIIGNSAGITRLEGSYNAATAAMAETASKGVTTTISDVLGAETLGNLAGTVTSGVVSTTGVSLREGLKLGASTLLGEIPYVGEGARLLPFMSVPGKIEKISQNLFGSTTKLEVEGAITTLEGNTIPILSIGESELTESLSNGKLIALGEGIYREAVTGEKIFVGSIDDAERVILGAEGYSVSSAGEILETSSRKIASDELAVSELSLSSEKVVGEELSLESSYFARESFQEIKSRLESGKFSELELERISAANEFLESNGLLPLTSIQEEELLLAHYSSTGNIDKVLRLGEAGFSEAQIKLLGDNYFFGNPIGVDFLYTSSGKPIPIPTEESGLYFDREGIMKYVNGLSDPEEKMVMTKVVENVQEVGFPEFLDNLKTSANKFNGVIENEPYVVVLKREGKSHQWAYDLVSDELTNKPVAFVYISGTEPGYLNKYFDSGIKNFVIFDDATYTGSQLTSFEMGENIHKEYQSWITNFAVDRSSFNEGMHYYAVTSAYTSQAEEAFEMLNSRYKGNLGPTQRRIQSTLISSMRMKTIDEILTPSEIDAALAQSIDSEKALTYFTYKVADGVSFPWIISGYIRCKNGITRVGGNEVYKIGGTDFYNSWLRTNIAQLLLIFKSFFIESFRIFK